MRGHRDKVEAINLGLSADDIAQLRGKLSFMQYFGRSLPAALSSPPASLPLFKVTASPGLLYLELTISHIISVQNDRPRRLCNVPIMLTKCNNLKPLNIPIIKYI